MNDDNMAVNDTDGEEAIADTTPVPEEQAPEEDQQLEDDVATDSDNQEAETVEESHKGAAARIRELNAQKKAAEEKAKSLEDRMREMTSPVGYGDQFNPPVSPQPTDDEINADGTVNAEKFRERVLREADTRTELRIRQSEAISRINTEANDVLHQFPELDPDNKGSFNKDLSDYVTDYVESGVRSNPYSASPKALARKAMNLYQKAVAKEAGQASENAAKTVSRTALRPTSIRKTEKPATEKSIEELEADLGMVIS